MTTTSYKVEKKTVPATTFASLPPGGVFRFASDSKNTYHVKLDAGSYSPLDKIGVAGAEGASLRFLATAATLEAPILEPLSLSITVGEE